MSTLSKILSFLRPLRKLGFDKNWRFEFGKSVIVVELWPFVAVALLFIAMWGIGFVI